MRMNKIGGAVTLLLIGIAFVGGSTVAFQNGMLGEKVERTVPIEETSAKMGTVQGGI